ARLYLHDAANGAVVAELPSDGPPSKIGDEPPDAYEQFAAFRPDGRQVVYADRADDRSCLRIWDVETQRQGATILDAERPAAWSPDGRALAYRFHVHGLHLWSVRLWQRGSGRHASDRFRRPAECGAVASGVLAGRQDPDGCARIPEGRAAYPGPAKR